ncbi:MAG: hypothetical protein Kow0022_10000 [Phycisphaerales bacterium]
MSVDLTGLLRQLQGFDPASTPISLAVLVGIGLACGLILWLFGRQVLKPIIAILGGAWGSALGILAPTWFGIFRIGDVPASLVGMGVGVLLGVLVGLALYRTLITFTTGLAFGTAGLLVSLAVLSAPPPAPDAAAEAAITAGASFEPGSEPVPQGQSISDAAEDVAEQASRFVRDSVHAITQRFNTLQERDRLRVLGATLGGLLVGLIVGLAAPGRASALVTAAFGSGLWLYCFAWLSIQQGASWAHALTLGPGGWMITWAIATAAGVAVQLLLWGRMAAKPAGASPPA